MVFGNKTLQGGGMLYEFTTFTFHSVGTVGRLGPSLSTLLASYDTGSNSWLNNTTFFDCSTTITGTQKWRVPVSGNYQITAIGSQGTDGSVTWRGGYGASMIGTFSLTYGTVLHIVAGQKNNLTGYASGGGASAVWISTETTPLIVAGGGGGGNTVTYPTSGYNASTTTSGVGSNGTLTGNGGDDGNGGLGSTTNQPGGGCGWITNGFPGFLTTETGGKTFLSGSAGGLGYTPPTYDGGFGGGGAGFGGGGGGGGYSGGGAGTYNDPDGSSGGGGGSYNSGTSQTNTISNTYNSGSVTITLL